MSPAGGCPSWQAMVSVRTSIVPPGPCPPLADTPGTSPAATTPQVTASIHDFAGSLLPGQGRQHADLPDASAAPLIPRRREGEKGNAGESAGASRQRNRGAEGVAVRLGSGD